MSHLPHPHIISESEETIINTTMGVSLHDQLLGMKKRMPPEDVFRTMRTHLGNVRSHPNFSKYQKQETERELDSFVAEHYPDAVHDWASSKGQDTDFPNV